MAGVADRIPCSDDCRLSTRDTILWPVLRANEAGAAQGTVVCNLRTHVTADDAESGGGESDEMAVDIVVREVVGDAGHVVSGSEVVNVFHNCMRQLHGIPKKIISDRGPQFTATFMKDLYKLLDIEGNLSSAYHPQTDGQTERFNAEVEKYLRVWINDKQDDWSDWVSMAGFALNNRTNSAGDSAFRLNYGRDPNMGVNLRRTVKNESAQQFADRMTQAWEDAKHALKAAAEHMKHDYDKRRPEARDYSIGDKVWLEATNIADTRPSRKLSTQRYGPFRITKKIGNSAYRLALPTEWRAIHPVFNEGLLSPWIPPEAPHQHAPIHAPQVLEEDGEEFEVDKILKSRMVNGQQQYLVRWKGYSAEHDTWEPAANLDAAQRKIREFQEGTSIPARRTRRSNIKTLQFPREVTPKVKERLTTGVDYSLPDPDFLRKYFSPRKRALFDPYPENPRKTFNLYRQEVT